MIDEQAGQSPAPRQWTEADIYKNLSPLSEVLPETPEPPQVDAVPLEVYSKHQYNTRQMREPDQLEDLCTCGEWVADWLEHHAEEAAKLASQSVPAVPEASTGGADSGEDSSDAQGAAEPDYVTVPITPQYLATRAIANIIDEHFGDDYEAAAWAAAEEIVRQGYAYPRLSSPLAREELGRRVADVCVKWSREDDEREGASATWDALNSHRRELYMRVGEAMFGLGMTFSPAPWPQGASSLQVLFAGACACLEVRPRIQLRRGARDGRPVLREAEHRRAGAGMRMTESNQTEDPRIRETRAVLDEADRSGACEGDGAYLASQLDRIRAIVDSAPPAPGVFFPGDTVPAGTWVMNGSTTETRTLVGHPERDWKVMFGPCVEVHGLPTPDEWQAAVDQAGAARADAEWQHTEGMTP
jgi:hypothetical protein